MIYLTSELIGAVLIGAVVGYASGLFGVGGGFMLTPLLIAVLRVEPIIAVGSGLAQMIFVGAGAGWRHAMQGYVDFRLIAYVAPSVVAGTTLGKYLLHGLTTSGMIAFASRQVPVVTIVLSGLFSLLLLGIALRLWRETPEEGTDRAAPLRWADGPWCVSLPQCDIQSVSLLSLFGAGLLIGVMAGLLGIGGGVVLIPLLVYGFGIHLRLTIGTSAVLIFVSSVAGAVQYALAGQVNYPLVLALIIGSAPMVQLGAWHSHRLHTHHLQRAFAVLVFVVAVISAGHLLWP